MGAIRRPFFIAMADAENLFDFYIKLIRETAEGTQKVVCANNGISLSPTSADQLKPIPVFEEEAEYSLLTSANVRAPTEIKWASSSYEYLAAYFKRYRRKEDNRLCNEIVVTANNYCAARFFAAKELMHCFMDDDGHHATNSVQLVQELIEDLTAGGSFDRGQPQTIVDEMAWIGASLYLVPSSWVPLLVKTRDAIIAEAPTANAYLHLAQLIRVPEQVLRLRLRRA